MKDNQFKPFQIGDAVWFIHEPQREERHTADELCSFTMGIFDVRPEIKSGRVVRLLNIHHQWQYGVMCIEANIEYIIPETRLYRDAANAVKHLQDTAHRLLMAAGDLYSITEKFIKQNTGDNGDERTNPIQ